MSPTWNMADEIAFTNQSKGESKPLNLPCRLKEWQVPVIGGPASQGTGQMRGGIIVAWLKHMAVDQLDLFEPAQVDPFAMDR